MIGKRITAIVVVVALALMSPVAIADEKRDGSTQDNTPSVDLIGGVDGSSNRALMTDPSGILRTTEEYPVEYQVLRQSMATGFRVSSGSIATPIIYPLGNSVAAYPFHHKGIWIDRESGVLGVHLFIYSSYDDIIFRPASSSAGWGAADTTPPDTLQTFLAASMNSIFVPIPDLYLGRFIGLFGFADSTADSSAVISLTFEGRMD